MPYQTFTQDDFAGLNEDESPEKLADNELVIAQNVCRFGSSFGTRPGSERESTATGNYSAQLSGAKPIQGLVDFQLPFTAGVRAASTQLAATLMVISDGKVYQDSSTSATLGGGVTISQVGATPNYWTFAQHKGVLYAAGGQDGDSILRWVGPGNNVTAVTFQNSSGTNIDAKYVCEKWNYGFLCGMNGTTVDDNPMIVRYSALGDMTSWPAGNTIGGTSTIGGFDSFGDNWTTGFASYTDNYGDWLLVLTRRALYGIQQQDIPQAPFYVGSNGIVANGCVHQRAFVSLGQDSGDAVYISESGIHSLRQSQQFGGREDKFLSWKIRNTFANATKSKLQNACGAYWEDEGLVLLAVPYLGGSDNTLLLALDTRGENALTAENARWYVWQLAGVTITSMAVVRDTNGTSRVYFGTLTGDIMRFTRASYDDVGSGYDVHWRTKDNDYGRGDRIKYFGDIYPSIRPGGDYQPSMTLIYDRGTRKSQPYFLSMPFHPALWNTAAWNSGVWSERDEITTPKQYGEGQGYALGIEFQHTVANQPFFVTRVVYEVAVEGESGGDTQ